MLVEGDRVPDALASHQDKARAVGEALGLVGASLEEGPGRPFVHGRHAEQVDNGRIEVLAALWTALLYDAIRDILGGKHLMVVVRIDGRRFILTVYVTGRLVGGQPYEGKHPVLI